MTRLSGLAALAAATIGIGAFAVTPATAVTFGVDPSSSVAVNVGAPVAATIALPSSFGIANVGDTATVDFITWTPTQLFSFGTPFTVTASLVLNSPPSGGTASGNGSGSVLTLLGVFVAGSLNWTGLPDVITFDDGTKITVNFEGGTALLLNQSVTTHAFVTLDVIGEAAPTPAETPLPGAVLLLGSVLVGGAGIGGWRKRKAKRAALASV